VAFFVVPYRVLFHDTMAYGTHHFLTNFKFQCEAREELLFGDLLAIAADRSAFEECAFLTQQGYTRTMAPVSVGERVGILLSLEEPTLSSVRFCFRVVRSDGAPVCCGYQTVICVSRRTQQLMAAPTALRTVEADLRERLRFPSFADRIVAGDLSGVFSDEVVALGKSMATAPSPDAYPRIVAAPGEAQAGESLAGGPMLLFPGQGSYSWPLLREVADLDEESARLLSRLDDLARETLSGSLKALVSAGSELAHRELLEATPGLLQVAIYATGALIGRALWARGVPVKALAGHSAGELNALAVGGAFSIEEGGAVVCRRAQALATAEGLGGMIALSTDPERTRRLLQVLAPAKLWIAVVNHGRQTVVSGAEESLLRLLDLATHLRIAATRLHSRYPFHSPLMEEAAGRFRESLSALTAKAPSVPVYSPLDERWYCAGDDLRALLSGHLTRQLDFAGAAAHLWRRGARQFVECGGGSALKGALSAIVAREGQPELEVFSAVGRGRLRDDLETVAGRWIGPTSNGVQARRSDGQAKPPIESVEPGQDAATAPQPIGRTPVAVVAMGCVLPGASDPARYWDNIVGGVGSLIDGATISPLHAADFRADGGVPEKTYTLLAGIIRPEEVGRVDGDGRWTLAQRLLALAIRQCRDRLTTVPSPARIQLLVGSTADGSVELDEALLQLELDRLAAGLQGDERRPLREALAAVTGRKAEDVARAVPSRAWREAAAAVLGGEVSCLAVDAACASSLYSTALGVAALRDGRCDLVFAGGVFAPGPVNSCLFSQFRGLSATGSRPFDAGADGVVFSSGAAIVALKRLPDALRDGDRVIALVRGFGMSSDGKSVSVTEPKPAGQKLALGRAYEHAAVAPDTLDLVEAHATSTPVGDAVELRAMGEVFASSSSDQPPLPVGSVKALIGHTGWAAGGASLIKVCAALEHETIPAQPNFFSPNPAVDLAKSRLVVPRQSRPWIRGAHPRRAGVNGFGFGGTNAHLVVEQFEDSVHGHWRGTVATHPSHPLPLAVVGMGALFPWLEDSGDRLRFGDASLRLPGGKRLLPDVADQMDRGQFLAVAAASRALEAMGAQWNQWRETIGVVLGVEGKTEKSMVAIKRVYADYVRRRIGEEMAPSTTAGAEAAWAGDLKAVDLALRGGGASNAYTLPGLMPNLVAGRVCNVLDLRGPNFVVDAGAQSFLQALLAAETLLRNGSCSIVLAGGVGSVTGPAASLMGASEGRDIGEAATVLALTRVDWARAEGLPVFARLRLDFGEAAERDARTSPVTEERPYLMGAEGSWEAIQAIERCRRSRTVETVQPRSTAGTLRFEPDDESPSEGAAVTETDHAFGDVRLTVPRWRVLPARPTNGTAGPTGSVLYLVDDPRSAEALAGDDGSVLICPASAVVPGALPIDLRDDATAKASLDAIDPRAFSRVVAIKNLADIPATADSISAAGGEALLDLLFATTKRFYERLRAGTMSLGALCTGVGSIETLHPITGLFGGFVKAIVRELPSARVRAVHTDDALGPSALARLDQELAQPPAGPVEVIYQGRHAGRLVLEEVRSIASEGEPLPVGAVVLMTGGARGVTAVLAEVLAARADCRVVLVGRTDPTAVPPSVLQMTDEAFAAYEPQFYEEETRRDRGQRPAELRSRYRQYQAARDVAAAVKTLRLLNPATVYRQVDITDPSAVDSLVASIAAEHGRLDLVVHGAGLQSSKRSDRKTLEEFRAVVAVKLHGIRNMSAAIGRHFPGRPPAYHLLTSAFSYFGNDGQPDYGAANEALGRLAQGGSSPASRWTALGWLGWADVGMTRGSEYAALARTRGLRPLAREEGKRIFSAVLSSATQGNNVLCSDGEIAFYGVECLPAAPVREPLEWRLSPTRQEFLSNHKVGGVPTLPGTFEVELAIQSAARLRPDRVVTAVEDARFERFVKVFAGRELPVRASSRIVFEDRTQTLVRVEIRSDFVHGSGAVLKRDVLHFEAFVRLEDTASVLSSELPPSEDPCVAVRDPYVDERAPVWLGAGFRCLQDIQLGDRQRRAAFRIEEPQMFSQLEDFVIPSVLLDGLCRFAMIRRDSDGSLPVYVPVSCRRLLVRPGNNDARLIKDGRSITLRAEAPRFDGHLIRNKRAEAGETTGQLLLVVEDLVARPMGVVPDA
jgi:acyl transferase domain-containing protein/NAD(P)-dependent dehydrogenase (short-subunit alcohol dehydrogenase family)/acyl-CoA thioesterase FadM